MTKPEIQDIPARNLEEAHPILADQLLVASRANDTSVEFDGDLDAYNIATAALVLRSGERFRPMWSRGLEECGAEKDAVTKCAELITRDTLRISASRTAERKHHYIVGAYGNGGYRPRRLPRD